MIGLMLTGQLVTCQQKRTMLALQALPVNVNGGLLVQEAGTALSTCQLPMRALSQHQYCRASAAHQAGSLTKHHECRHGLLKSLGFRLQQTAFPSGTGSRRHATGCQQHAWRTSRTVSQSSAQTASVSSPEAIKTALFQALDGTDRGIYGVPVGTSASRICTEIAISRWPSSL